MKRKNSIFLWFGILLLFLLAEIWTEEKMSSVSDSNLSVLSLKTRGETFDREHIMKMSEEKYDFSPYGESIANVSTWRKEKDILVISTNENWEYITNEKMICGTWFNGLQVEQNMLVTVLNREAALQLFGTSDAVLNEVKMNGRYYVVVGVVDEKSKEPKAYVPYTSMANYNKSDQAFSQLWVLLDGKAEEQFLCMKLGFESEEIKSFSIKSYQDIIHMRSKSMMFFIGLILGMKLIFLIFERGKLIGLQWNNFLETHYFLESYQMIKKREIQKHLIYIVGSLCLLFIICRLTWFIPVFHGTEFMKNHMGVMEWIRKILYFYIQPEMLIQKYHILEEWNIFSVVISFLFIMIGFIGWWQKQICHKKRKN